MTRSNSWECGNCGSIQPNVHVICGSCWKERRAEVDEEVVSHGTSLNREEDVDETGEEEEEDDSSLQDGGSKEGDNKEMDEELELIEALEPIWTQAVFAYLADKGTDVSHHKKEEELESNGSPPRLVTPTIDEYEQALYLHANSTEQQQEQLIHTLPEMALPSLPTEQEMYETGLLAEGESAYAGHPHFPSSSFGGSSVVNPFQCPKEVLEGMYLANGTYSVGEYVLSASTCPDDLSPLEGFSKRFFEDTANCKTREAFVSSFIGWRLEVIIHMHKKLEDLADCFPQLGPEPSLWKICNIMIGKQYPTDKCAELAPEIFDEHTGLFLRGYDGMPGNLTRPNNACVHEALSGVWTKMRRNILRKYFGVGWEVDIPAQEVDAPVLDCLPFSMKPPSKKPDGTRLSKDEHEKYLDDQFAACLQELGEEEPTVLLISALNMFGHAFASYLSTGEAMLVQPMTPRFKELFLPQAQGMIMSIQANVFHMQTLVSGFVRDYDDDVLARCDKILLETAGRIGIFSAEEKAALDMLGDAVTEVVYLPAKHRGKTVKEKLVLTLCRRLKEGKGDVKVFSKEARNTYGIDIVERYVETNIKCLMEKTPWKISRIEDVTFQQAHAFMASRGGIEKQRLLREATKAVEKGTANLDQEERVLARDMAIDENFQKRLKQMKAFKKKHGSFDNMHKIDSSLNSWCKNMRQGRYNSNSNTICDNDRIKALDAIGFDWKPHEITADEDIFMEMTFLPIKSRGKRGTNYCCKVATANIPCTKLSCRDGMCNKHFNLYKKFDRSTKDEDNLHADEVEADEANVMAMVVLPKKSRKKRKKKYCCKVATDNTQCTKFVASGCDGMCTNHFKLFEKYNRSTKDEGIGLPPPQAKKQGKKRKLDALLEATIEGKTL